MDATTRIQQALEAALKWAEVPESPPKLAAAIRYAVFPGGARIRPRLCLAVASACGDDQPDITNAAAAAIELLHCGSLVHDDLPCFDNADTRRGQPSVHKAFGETQAVLVGDALIVMAFEALARATVATPQRLPGLILTVAQSTGMPSGIIAGQAWEDEPMVSVSKYHRAKTGSLFAASTICGALAAGVDPAPWRELGERIGEAYQVADDLHDVLTSSTDLGKPAGQDAAHNRPSATTELGYEGAVLRLQGLMDGAIQSIPDCPGAEELRNIIGAAAKAFIPKNVAQRAA